MSQNWSPNRSNTRSVPNAPIERRRRCSKAKRALGRSTFGLKKLHAHPSNTHSHSPQRTHQSHCTNAHGLRAMHTSHLLLSTTLKRPCSLPPPLRPPRLSAPCPAHGSDHVSQQNRTCYRRAAMESKIGANRISNPCVNHNLVSQGWNSNSNSN